MDIRRFLFLETLALRAAFLLLPEIAFSVLGGGVFSRSGLPSECTQSLSSFVVYLYAE